MRYLSVCSGIEAATVAWHELGWNPVAFAEIDPFCSHLLAHYYPAVPNLGDINAHESWPVEPGMVDILVGGTPCQDWSAAGLGAGLAGDNGKLTRRYLELAGWLRPQWLVWENTASLLNRRHSGDFAAILGELRQHGYYLAWRVLDAQWFGVAQRRQRVFLVGHLGDWRPAAAVLFQPESLSRHAGPMRAPGQEVAGSLKASSGSRGFDADEAAGGQVIGCLTSSTGGQPMDSQVAAGHAIVQPTLMAAGCDAIEPENMVIVAGCLTTRGSRHAPHAETLIPIAFDPQQITSGENRSNPQPGGPAPALSTDGRMAVAFNARQDPNFYGNQSGALDRFDNSIGVHAGMMVRRLTPLERERLQGFPDGYTAIPYRRWKVSPDTRRAHAIGNSMAVPVMRWLGERIEMVNVMMAEAAERSAA